MTYQQNQNTMTAMLRQNQITYRIINTLHRTYLSWNIFNIEDIFTERYYRFQKDASKDDQIITGINEALKAGNALLELSKLTHNLEVNTTLKDIYDKTYLIQREKRRSGLVSDLEVNDSYVQKDYF